VCGGIAAVVGAGRMRAGRGSVFASPDRGWHGRGARIGRRIGDAGAPDAASVGAVLPGAPTFGPVPAGVGAQGVGAQGVGAQGVGAQGGVTSGVVPGNAALAESPRPIPGRAGDGAAVVISSRGAPSPRESQAMTRGRPWRAAATAAEWIAA
jgi:hypothetical protein